MFSPKCEIFDRSDFHNFYTIKSQREDDFGVKIKKYILGFIWGREIPYAYAHFVQSKNLRRSVAYAIFYASVTDAYLLYTGQ
jgi:hypothetical protein